MASAGVGGRPGFSAAADVDGAATTSCGFPMGPSMDATSLPSGEIAGWNSSPGALVTCRMFDVMIVIGVVVVMRTSTTATTTSNAAARMPGANHCHEPDAAGNGRVSVGVMPPLGVASASNCGSNSSALWNRSAGFFSRHRMTIASSAAGTVSRCLVTGCGGSVMCADNTICGVVPMNTGRPVNSSYATAPNA